MVGAAWQKVFAPSKAAFVAVFFGFYVSEYGEQMKIKLLAANLLFIVTVGGNIANAQDPRSTPKKDGGFLPSAPDGAGGGGITIKDPVTDTFCEHFTVNGGCADQDDRGETSKPEPGAETPKGTEGKDTRNQS